MEKQTQYWETVDMSEVTRQREAERTRMQLNAESQRQYWETVEPTDVTMVRMRLSQWQDYHENRSASQPGPAYGATAKVADEIYQSRRPTIGNSTPDPKLDLRVSDDAIVSMITQKRQSQQRRERKI